jgi:hypothetical protein
MTKNKRFIGSKNSSWAFSCDAVSAGNAIRYINGGEATQTKPIFISYQLCKNNNTRSTGAVPMKLSVRNIRCSCTASWNRNNSTVNPKSPVIAYIIKVPEGITITPTITQDHPEWILAYRMLGDQKTDGEEMWPTVFSTRKRTTLYSGDSLNLIVDFNYSIDFTSGSQQVDVSLSGVVSYLSKAN